MSMEAVKPIAAPDDAMDGPAGAAVDLVDPALDEQMRAEAERAADDGAAQALSEAQQQSQEAQQREQAEEAQDGQLQQQQQFDLGQEFSQYAPTADQQTASASASAQHQPQQPQTSYTDPSGRTFLTGLDHSSQSNLQQPQPQYQYQTPGPQPDPAADSNSMRMSDEELMSVLAPPHNRSLACVCEPRSIASAADSASAC